MTTKATEKLNIIAFTQAMAADSCVLPLAIVRDYREWGLGDRELAPLIRIIAPALKNGSVTMEQIASEFSCTEEKAQTIIRYFCSRGLIEYNKELNAYTCRKLLELMTEKWLTERRLAQTQSRSAAREEKQAAVSRDNSALPETELLQKQSRLYRCFERDFGRNLRYSESDQLRTWLEDDQFPPELIEEALRRAALQNKCSFAYISSILSRWQAQGLTTLADVLSGDARMPAAAEEIELPKQRSRQKKKKEPGKFSDITDDLL